MLEGAIKQEHEYCCGKKMDVRLIYDLKRNRDCILKRCYECGCYTLEDKYNRPKKRPKNDQKRSI
jgi:hypothetical protein